MARPPSSGCPPGAGGVFMQGGTIGNLSALVAAREQRAPRASARPGRAARRRWKVVCSAEAHSSIASAAARDGRRRRARAPGDDGMLRGDDGASRARRARGIRLRRRRDRRDSTNFGIVDDIASIAARHARLATSGCTSTAPTGSPRMLVAARCGPRSRASSTPTRSSSIRTSGCSRRSTRARSSTAIPSRARARAHAARRVPRHPHRDGRLEPVGLRASSSPGAPAACRCGSRSRRTAPTGYRAAIDHGITARARHRRRDRGRATGSSLVRDPQLSVVVFRREGWTPADYQRVVGPPARRAAGRSSCRARTRARPCCASRSSARSRRSRRSPASSTRLPEPHAPPSSASRASTRPRISSRIGRTASMPWPAGSASSQSS